MAEYLRKKFTLKDILVFSCSFIFIYVVSFILMLENEEITSSIFSVSKIFSILAFIVISCNMSHILYVLFSKPQNALKFISRMTKEDRIKKFLRLIILVNALSVMNILIINITGFFTYHWVKTILLSLSLSIWPIIILLLISIDYYLDHCCAKTLENEHANKGISNPGQYIL